MDNRLALLESGARPLFSFLPTAPFGSSGILLTKQIALAAIAACMTLCKLFNLTIAQCSHLKNEAHHVHLIGQLRGVNKKMRRHLAKCLARDKSSIIASCYY